jgi:hypothetical protein
MDLGCCGLLSAASVWEPLAGVCVHNSELKCFSERAQLIKGKGKGLFSGFIRHWGYVSLLYPRHWELPSFTTRGAVYQQTQRTLLAKELWNLATNFAISEKSWVLFDAPKLGHGTDYFTSPPKKGMLSVFPIGKIPRLRSGANPRSWVPEASMLTPKRLDDRSRLHSWLTEGTTLSSLQTHSAARWHCTEHRWCTSSRNLACDRSMAASKSRSS